MDSSRGKQKLLALNEQQVRSGASSRESASMAALASPFVLTGYTKERKRGKRRG